MNKRDFIIRPAILSDAESIRAIQAPYILTTAFNLEETVGTIRDYEAKIMETSLNFPFLVAEYNNAVIGFTYANESASSLRIPGLCALSIYVAQDVPIRGIGQALYNAIEAELIARGLTYIISNIVSSNERSIKFHEKNDFHIVSQFPHVGFKHNEWFDVVWMAKNINLLHITFKKEALIQNPFSPFNEQDI